MPRRIRFEKSEERTCFGCGTKLVASEKTNRIFREKGLTYCIDYCCGCCPDSHTHPCQKEKIDGTMIQNLAKLQNTL